MLNNPDGVITTEPVKAITINTGAESDPLLKKDKKEVSCYDNCCSFFQAVGDCLSACHEVCHEAQEKIPLAAGML